MTYIAIIFSILFLFNLNISAQETIPPDSIISIYGESLEAIPVLTISTDVYGGYVECRSDNILLSYNIRGDQVYYEETCGHRILKRNHLFAADTKSFRQISDKYAKDKYYVYYEGKVLPGVDPKTFELNVSGKNNGGITNPIFAKNGKYIMINGETVLNSDSKTFCRISDEYYADKNNIYHKWGNIPEDADPKDIKLIGDDILISNNHVFYNSETVRSADTGSFQATDIADYYKDKEHYFFLDELLEDSDSKKELKEIGSSYSSNNGNVYYGGDKIEDADIFTFELMDESGFYARDKNHVYKYGEIMDGINTKTFRPGDEAGEKSNESVFSVKDGNVYRKGEKIELDAVTFRIINEEFACDSSKLYSYRLMAHIDGKSFEKIDENIYRDKNTLYLVKGSHLESSMEIDGESLHQISKKYYADKNNVYAILDYPDKIRIVEDADPYSFGVIDEQYAKDKTHIYAVNWPLDGANPEDYKTDNGYLFSNGKVFFQSFLIEDADFSTFEPTEYAKAKDRNNLYIRSWKILYANPETYKIFDEEIRYDDNHIWDKNGHFLGKADGKSFSRIQNSISNNIFKDNDYLYLNSMFSIEKKKIPADGRTIRLVEDNYFIDKNQVIIGIVKYVNEDNDNPIPRDFAYIDHFKVIEGADLASFTPIDQYFAKDKNHVYYNGEIIEKADSKSFRVISTDTKRSYDKNHIYDRKRIVEDIHSSFFYLGGSFFKDKDYLYYIEGYLIKKFRFGEETGIDGKSLKLITTDMLRDKKRTYKWENFDIKPYNQP